MYRWLPLKSKARLWSPQITISILRQGPHAMKCPSKRDLSTWLFLPFNKRNDLKNIKQQLPSPCLVKPHHCPPPQHDGSLRALLTLRPDDFCKLPLSSPLISPPALNVTARSQKSEADPVCLAYVSHHCGHMHIQCGALTLFYDADMRYEMRHRYDMTYPQYTK